MIATLSILLLAASATATRLCNPKHSNCTALLLIQSTDVPLTHMEIRITSPIATDYFSAFENIPPHTTTGVFVPAMQSFDFISTQSSASESGSSTSDTVLDDVVMVLSASEGREVVVADGINSCESNERSLRYISTSSSTYYLLLSPNCIALAAGTNSLSYCVSPAFSSALYSDSYCSTILKAAPSLPQTTNTAYCAVSEAANVSCVTSDVTEASSTDSSTEESTNVLAIAVSTTTIGALLVIYCLGRVKNKRVVVGNVVIYKLPKSLRARGSKRDYGYGLIVAVDATGATKTSRKVAIQPLLRVMRCAPPTANATPALSPLKNTHSWVSTRQITISPSKSASITVRDTDQPPVSEDKAPNKDPKDHKDSLIATKGLELAPDKKQPLLYLSRRDIWGLSGRIIAPATVSQLDSITAEENRDNGIIEEESASDNEASDEEKPLLLTYLEETQSLRNRYRRGSTYMGSKILEPAKFSCCAPRGKVMDAPLELSIPSNTTTTYRIQKPAYLKRVHLNTYFYNPKSEDPETESVPTPNESAAAAPESAPAVPTTTVKDTISGLPLASQLNLKSSPRKMTLLRSTTTADSTPTSTKRVLARGNSISSSRSYSISPRRLPSISLPTARNNSVAPDPIVPSEGSSFSTPESPTPMARAFSRLYSMPRGTSFQDTHDPLTPSLYKKKDSLNVTEIE